MPSSVWFRYVWRVKTQRLMEFCSISNSGEVDTPLFSTWRMNPQLIACRIVVLLCKLVGSRNIKFFVLPSTYSSILPSHITDYSSIFSETFCKIITKRFSGSGLYCICWQPEEFHCTQMTLEPNTPTFRGDLAFGERCSESHLLRWISVLWNFWSSDVVPVCYNLAVEWNDLSQLPGHVVEQLAEALR